MVHLFYVWPAYLSFPARRLHFLPSWRSTRLVVARRALIAPAIRLLLSCSSCLNREKFLESFFTQNPWYFIEPDLPAWFQPLSDEQWLLIRDLFPPPSNALGGRPPINERRVLDGILFKLATGSPWYDIPEGYPSWQTCYRRFRLWQRLGLFDHIFYLLYQDLCQRGGIDLLQAIRDGRLGFVWEHDQRRLVCPPELEGGWRQSIAITLLRYYAYHLRNQSSRNFSDLGTDAQYEADMAELEPSMLSRFTLPVPY